MSSAGAAHQGIKSDSCESMNGSAIPPTDTQSFAELCAHMHGRLQRFLAEDVKDERLSSVQEQTRISLDVISEALHKYNITELSLSYNGGKDCLVLLILYLAALHQVHSNSSDARNEQLSSLQSVYIQSPNPFNEVESFVASSVAMYFLALATYAAPMKIAFTNYLREYPKVKAIFVGTRRTDPHGADLTHFDRTDSGWPDFMRIHPVIDWHYVDIWTFIRHLKIPYCSLYDQGYTSLGGTTDTHPNPALQRRTSDQGATSETFRPAYELVEDQQERLGRDR
ncbi:phosphoadenosine phosphosulfate reductase [Pseudovirgaria hyperparasitica]|uniref:FAD synthase n=1 Tax=Pseudovirgaria hyperparasitica TaxID=470096 RepID=A0A6A6VXT4_9PEZI|nr:phosphoadenosine phosphosulfate reductase [Pseudovirgaria hyperparasitica]KAF2754616.1 phosphoadenosine phosphosulfate reductase [Pseudovirgaria hyperparasitica]